MAHSEDLTRDQIQRIWRDEAAVEDTWAGGYDDFYQNWQPCYGLYKESVANLVLASWKQRTGPVLEIGCGTAQVLERLSSQIPAQMLHGVDISPEMIRVAQRKVRGAHFHTMPFEQFQSSEPFSVVYFCGSLHHMPDQRLVAETIHRIAAPGARIVVCEPNANWMYQDLWTNRFSRIVSPRWIYLRLRNAAMISKIMRAMGKLSEPAFHQHLDLDALQRTFGPFFRQISCTSDFHRTRLFEGVVLDTPGHEREIARLRAEDAKLQKRYPLGGGSIELVFEKPVS